MALEQKLNMMQGARDLLILRIIRTRALHGWAISKRIVEVSRDVLQVNPLDA